MIETESPFDTAPVRLWALVDLVATGPLLVPVSALWFIDALLRLNELFAEPMPAPELAGLQLFFVCLAGALGVLWALVRLSCPLPTLSLADVLGRLWVAGLIAVFISKEGLPAVLWCFVLTETAGAVHQSANLLRRGAQRRRRRPSGSNPQQEQTGRRPQGAKGREQA
jgi:hypothetical protein